MATEPLTLRSHLLAAVVVWAGLSVAIGLMIALVVMAMGLYHGDLVPRYRETWRVLVYGPLFIGGMAGLSILFTQEFFDRLAWHWQRWQTARRGQDEQDQD